ncbi:PREDICTED: putative disease resistance RPP13-like protein 1 [Camelina sativa]|uniref:Disease resistance RPP13-like protein 1 n=1 Tax=Camelina sativa TaxID=90675 RepID=A0ABM1QZN6_CAMSA|nr:PREDICTED: putative disease resistance RPP13-like protein 1 [Camelina sativa]
MIVGEMFLSAFLQALFQTLMSAPFNNFFKRRELNENVLERLNTVLLTISAVLIDAEEKQITNPVVEKWVNELRDVVYHAEDALDDIATEALRLNIGAESSSSNRLRQLCGRMSLGDFLDGNSENLEIRLEKVTMRLERLASQRNVLGLKELTAMVPKQRLPTTSLVDESEVFGRTDDKDEIMRYLIPEDANDNGLTVVAIVGTGGVGKTTLSQLLYNDQRVQSHFGTRVWAHVSEEFDVFKITKKVYESVTSRPCEFTDLDVLQVKLKERLTGLPFLLVLDDLWNENFVDWDLLRQPFIHATQGSRILVTTRSQRVASNMCSVYAHKLQPLSDGDCWSLFVKTVFGNQDPCLDQEIGDLAERIVHKCRGLPLAVKTLGGVLRFEGKVIEWERVLSSRIWDLPADKSNLLQVLRVSYYYLPAHLKRCFAYCSIFPKGHAFEKDKVVLLWMAEGFLQQTRSNKTLEELGDEYFSELESRSLFQKTKTRYIMHDFINELSQFASGEFSSKFENGYKLQVSERTRYLSYLRDNYAEPMEFEALREVKFLRTFLPLSLTNSSRSCCLDTMVSEKLLSTLTRLRVLSLSHYKIARLPQDFFRNLSHVRFLDLSRTELEKLPKSLCYMYNLQILLLTYCSSLKELPTDICNLINMRYLDLIGTKLRQMPRRFGRLKSLQTLTTFFVSASDGARICELGELHELHGKLRLVELQRVVDVADAAGANLDSKKHLKEIDFVWRTGTNSLESNTNPHRTQNEAEVFEKLRPHKHIERVTIERYKGRRFPKWLNDSSFSRIVFIRLRECHYCSSLPSLGQLPGLKELYISGMAGLRRVGTEFYFSDPQLRDRDQQPFRSLETLRFDNLSDWEEWLDGRVTSGDLFPSLKKLYILRCPELTRIPAFLPSLISLHIHKCGLLDFQPEHNVYSYGNLQTLSIKSSCDSLSTFPLSHFTNLINLEFDQCTSLHSLQLSNEHLSDLNALRNLRINDCQNLQLLPELNFLSQNLQVTISNCRYLRQPMEQQPQYHQHPQFHLPRSNVSGSPRSHASSTNMNSMESPAIIEDCLHI